MQNFINHGEHLTIPAVTDVISGEVIVAGDLVGVAQGAAQAGEPVVIVRRGLFELPKAAGAAWAVGAKIYWDAEDGVCTTLATDNRLIGAAQSAAASSALVGRVLLDGVIR